ncbi:hypothetical protein EDC04DRAFT_2941782 [Pisolithus marmoratus]|nr:hypothetical protein EDC04DRAFT_2941782 [Pisolithus marmoratus]
MTSNQQSIFDNIVHYAVNGDPLYAFINGKAGRGKTFLINAICNKICMLPPSCHPPSHNHSLCSTFIIATMPTFLTP